MSNEINDDIFPFSAVTFILSKFAHFDFKGVEIELTYNLIVKLQNTYKQLLNK